jgi:hypothetical protein
VFEAAVQPKTQQYLKLPLFIIKYIIDKCNTQTKSAFKVTCIEFKQYVCQDYYYYLDICEKKHPLKRYHCYRDTQADEFVMDTRKTGLFKFIGYKLHVSTKSPSIEELITGTGGKDVLFNCDCLQRAMKNNWFKYGKRLYVDGVKGKIAQIIIT